MSRYPFHFSFLVKDLLSTRRFYGEILGCPEGRSSDSWVDFNLGGNQLSMHVSEKIPESFPCGVVDSVIVPIPHFGCIMPWDEFHVLAEKLHKEKVEFIIEPGIRFAGQPGEQATMFFKDPSGNSLEIKSFKNPEHIFTLNVKQKKYGADQHD
jgi:extradiol dioxygenase family protein